MTDNIRYALYQSAYTVVNAGKADKEPDEIVTVAGKCCERRPRSGAYKGC